MVTPWNKILHFFGSLWLLLDSTHAQQQSQQLLQQEQHPRDSVLPFERHNGRSDETNHGNTRPRGQQQRSLASGDFAEFNQLIQNAVITFPDSSLTQSLMTLEITELQCTGLQLEDLRVSSRTTSSQTVLIDVEVVGLDMDCAARYHYDGLLLNGRGNVTVKSYGNQAVVSASITSSNLNEVAPSILQVESCTPTISMNDLQFDDGGLLGVVLDRVEGLLRNIFENSAERQLCQELTVVLEETVGQEWLTMVSNTLNDYKTDSEVFVDPLVGESDLVNRIPPNLPPLLSLQDKQTKFGQWADMTMNQVVAYLNKPVSVFDEVTGGDAQDLQVNVLLRQWILEKGTRALVLDMSSTSFFDGDNDTQSDNIIYKGQNSLFDTTIRLDKAQLLGLDTLKTFEPLVDIGQYTLENSWIWEYLSFDIDLTIEVQASTAPYSIINGPPGEAPVSVVEQVRVQFGIRELEALGSVLLAINQSLLESVRVGSLLQTSQLLPCLLATIYQMEFSTLSVTASTVETPSVNGFVSQGIDRVVSEALDAAFLLYEQIALDASPAFFQQWVRDQLNTNLVDKYIDVAKTCTVQDQDFGMALVDFRDLLLEPQEALALGATGTSPYGNVISEMIMPGLKEQVLNDQEHINAELIRPFTKKQSGQEGMLSFPSSVLFELLQETETVQNPSVDRSPSFRSTNSSMPTSPSAASLWDRLEVRVSNIRILNIDTVTAPMLLLEPTESNLLSNRILLNSSGFMNMGEGQRQGLKLTVRLLLAIDGDNSPLAMSNEMDLSLVVPSASVAFDILANLQEQALIDFPLNDVTNVHCWLAALASGRGEDILSSASMSNVQLNLLRQQSGDSTNGQVDNQATSNLALKSFILSISSFTMEAACIACSSPGAPFLSEVIDTLEQAGMSEVFTNRIEQILEATLWEYWNAFEIYPLLRDAPRFCPSSLEYEPNATANDYAWPSLPNVSATGVETAVALGLLSMYVSLMVVAKNHLVLPPTQSIENDKDETLGNIFDLNGGRPVAGNDYVVILDFTDLSKTFGGWGQVVFEEFRRYLNGATPVPIDLDLSRTLGKHEELGINELLRTHLLNEEGAFDIEFEDTGIQGSGFNIALTSCQIFGLDSITNIDALHVAGPNMLVSELLVDRVELVLDVNITVSGEQSRQMKLSNTIKDIYIQANITLAMDLNSLGKIPLGSVLERRNILNCAMTGVQKLEISKLQVVTGIIETPRVDKYFESEVQDSFSRLVESLFDEYRSDLISSIPIIFETTVRHVLNTQLPSTMRRLAGKCVPPALDESSRKGFVDFRDLFLSEATSSLLGGRGDSPYGNLFRTVYWVLKDKVLTNSQSLNTLLGQWSESTSNTSGTLMLPGNTVNTKSSLSLAGLQADLGFKLSDVSILNLNTVGDPLELALPIKDEAYILNNTVSLGVGSDPLQLVARVFVSLTDSGRLRVFLRICEPLHPSYLTLNLFTLSQTK
jgi:hypothetical protein